MFLRRSFPHYTSALIRDRDDHYVVYYYMVIVVSQGRIYAIGDRSHCDIVIGRYLGHDTKHDFVEYTRADGLIVP